MQRSPVHTSPARRAALPPLTLPSPPPPPHAQAQQRAHAAKAFEQIVDKLQALVEKVCKDVMTRARLSDETLSGAPADGEEGGDGGAKHRSKSMAKMREEQQARAPPEGKDGRTPHPPAPTTTTRRHPTAPLPSLPSLQARLAAVRRAAAEAQMLGDFIRLADYMTVSCCYLLTLSTAERLLELLSTPRKTGLWITTVEFGKSGMAFTPPQAHFMGSLQSLLEGMINNIHAVPRLLYMRPFKPYALGRVSYMARHAQHSAIAHTSRRPPSTGTSPTSRSSSAPTSPASSARPTPSRPHRSGSSRWSSRTLSARRRTRSSSRSTG